MKYLEKKGYYHNIVIVLQTKCKKALQQEIDRTFKAGDWCLEESRQAQRKSMRAS